MKKNKAEKMNKISHPSIDILTISHLRNILGGNQDYELEELFTPAIGLAIHAIRMKLDNGGNFFEIN